MKARPTATILIAELRNFLNETKDAEQAVEVVRRPQE